ncbi:protein phosphatase 1 regulatory subunit 16A [Elysia marginata]|uniref:Protein phosphatase 1 regulatory subunit 16A n=1 Tax=Elysia marginata TaxID=1093978 RepID=A0AAV4HZ62_9GAST|nr:protein phosphatase 1 regulatory subunit 16A [Elysia marginata]
MRYLQNPFKDHHTETVKQLVLAGAALDAENCNHITPIQLAKYDSDTWDVLNDAKRGDMPELEDELEVPDIPDYALPDGADGKKGKKKKSGKKGKKGKGKKGKKSGGKKKGKKKKKK